MNEVESELVTTTMFEGRTLVLFLCSHSRLGEKKTQCLRAAVKCTIVSNFESENEIIRRDSRCCNSRANVLDVGELFRAHKHNVSIAFDFHFDFN